MPAALAAGMACVIAALTPPPLRAQTPADLQDTKHNLSATGPGPIQALTETRSCIFCHTPHNATPLSPLWNKELEPQAYTMYTSATMKAGPLGQPTGATKLCLSCHDGTIAMGAVVNPAGGITMSGGGTLTPGSLADFGLDLSAHHPVSFPYHLALPNQELAPTPPPDLTYGAVDEIHCTTCHDPHKDAYGKFLVKSNRYSALCTSCHQMTGWAASAHATSSVSVAGLLPRPPKTWPTWTTLGEWGCETCHTPHFAPTGEQLLNFTTAPPDPFTCTTAGCHASEPASPHPAASLIGGSMALPAVGATTTADIAGQIRKISAHREPPGTAATSLGGAGRGLRSGIRSAGCADCHNPHLVSTVQAEAPYASGLLRGVGGIDRNGALVKSATYEYEVCFKCHADSTPDLDYVPRVIPSVNTRLAFDTAAPSYHPVVGMGRNLAIPSIPSPFAPAMSPAQMIYCSDCHADDEGGSRGPHGSNYAPILKLRYETADFTPESYDTFALCYQCHDRSSILRDDSFRRAIPQASASGGGHSGHLAAGIPCSACHDPHGVPALSSPGSGSHTHLINFDTRIVLPAAGGTVPLFTDTGQFSGSCTLSCHGVTHQNASYP